MRRRDFMTLAGATVAASPPAALAEAPSKVYRIGLLNIAGPDGGPFEAPFLRGLALRGYVRAEISQSSAAAREGTSIAWRGSLPSSWRAKSIS